MSPAPWVFCSPPPRPHPRHAGFNFHHTLPSLPARPCIGLPRTSSLDRALLPGQPQLSVQIPARSHLAHPSFFFPTLPLPSSSSNRRSHSTVSFWGRVPRSSSTTSGRAIFLVLNLFKPHPRRWDKPVHRRPCPPVDVDSARQRACIGAVDTRRSGTWLAELHPAPRRHTRSRFTSPVEPSPSTVYRLCANPLQGHFFLSRPVARLPRDTRMPARPPAHPLPQVFPDVEAWLPLVQLSFVA